MAITFSASRFRERFPEFTTELFPMDSVLTMCFNRATCYIPNQETRCLNGACLEEALYLLTAHLCFIRNETTNGKGSGIVTSASVGGVSVSLTPPPVGTSQWDWWLNTTPYGAELTALLDGLSITGMYVGSRCERAAFRKVGGVF